MIRRALLKILGGIFLIVLTYMVSILFLGTVAWWQLKAVDWNMGLSLFQFWGLAAGVFAAGTFLFFLTYLFVSLCPDSWKNRVRVVALKLKPLFITIGRIVEAVDDFIWNTLLGKIMPVFIGGSFFILGILILIKGEWKGALVSLIGICVALILFFLMRKFKHHFATIRLTSKREN